MWHRHGLNALEPEVHFRCAAARILVLAVTAALGTVPASWAAGPPGNTATAGARPTAITPPIGDRCEASVGLPPPFLAKLRALEGAGALVSADAGDLRVSCALPYTSGKPGGDCTGKHNINFSANKAGAKLTAELMGLDVTGNLIQSFVVPNGATVQMASRIRPADWKLAKSNNKDYTVFAPVPLVKVTAEFEGETAVAYCSDIPWVDVLQPSGGVVTDGGDGSTETKVLAAVPRTNPLDLHLYVDGTDLFAPGVMTPALPPLTACTFDAPCEGTATVNGTPVHVTDIIVDVASDISSLSSNTVRATLNDLSCGGHFVRVETSQAIGALKSPTSESCNVDDLKDTGRSSVFAITIDDPVAGQVTPIVPTPVKGLICGGTDIVSANINGKVLDVSSQTKVPGDGVTTGDVVTYQIDTTLQQTDLRADFDGTTTELGTFAPGSNRLVAAALEAKGTRAYRRVMFAVGSNIKPLGIDPGAVIINQQTLQEAVDSNLKSMVESKLQVALTATEMEIKNAFLVGLTAEGAQTVMSKLCNAAVDHDNDPATPNQTAGQIFKNAVEAALGAFTESNPITTFPYEPTCSCDITAKVFIDGVTVGDTLSCPIEFVDDKIKVSLLLPDVRVTARAKGFCDDTFGHTDMNIFATADIKGTHFDYELTEANVLAASTATSNECDTPGACTTTFPNSFKVGGTFAVTAGGGVDFGFVGDVCNFVIDTFVTVLTFGQVDIGPLLTPQIDITEVVNFEQEIGPAQPNAIPLNGIKVDEQVNGVYHQKMSGLVSEVHITGPTNAPSLEGAGITLGLKGTFATTKVDADVEGNPGIEVHEPPIPVMSSLRTQGGKDATVGLSDGAINAMLAGLGVAGDMKVANSDAQGCFSSGATIGSLLPPSCEDINLGVGLELATATARGYCHAIKGDACDPLLYPDPDPTGIDTTALLSGTERGVCHGAKGAVCSSVSPEGDLVEIAACSVTPNFNLHKDQNLMFCAKGDLPTMGFPSAGATPSTVPTELQLNDLSVSLVIDRGANNTVDGLLKDLPGCFSGTQTASDCNVFAACLDINLQFNMNNIICAGNKPGFQAEFTDLLPIFRKVGEVCSGTTSPTTDTTVLTAASDGDTITKPIALNAALLSPPICGSGLDMGGFVSCSNAAILAVEADGNPKFRDFLAITCKLQ